MLRNYFRLISRILFRNKVYSLINILGFSIGLAGFILIILFVRHELVYDKFYADHDRIYRVTRSWYNDDGEESLHLARVAAPVGALLAEDYPHILDEVVRVLSWDPILKVGENKFEGRNMFFAENNFFRIFDTPLLRGDTATALSEPMTMVLSQSVANQYFGDADPMGKTVLIPGAGLFTITGIFPDLPDETHFKYEILVSFITLENYYGKENLMRDWSGNNYVTYLKIKKSGTEQQLASQLDDFIDRHYTPVVAEYLGHEPDERVSNSTKIHMQRLTDIHLRSHLNTELEPNGDIRSVYIFTSVAFFILLIAIINFINLTTARSAMRAREVSMRKVSGAPRSKLVSQFLFESVILTFLSLGLAVVFVTFMLPYFGNFMSRELSIIDQGLLEAILILFGVGLIVGIISGLYPAFFLSRFNPVRILKASQAMGKSTSPLRTILVVFQFSISIILIISIGVIKKQLDYLQDMDLGFNRENVVILGANDNILNNIETFKARMFENPDIQGVTSGRLIPSDDLINSSGGTTVDGENPGNIDFRLAVVSVDYDYFENFQIEILAGRDFSISFETDDSISFILNAKAVDQLGWGDPENAIDRPFIYGGIRGTIIGVVDDINFETLHNPIVPIIYYVRPSQNSRLCIKLRGKNVQNTLDYIEEIWSEYSPDGLYYYSFLDERYKDKYRTEFQLGKVISFFSIFAIIIACLGLFGLSSFMAERKTKEIGIRKVLGATVSQVVLSQSYGYSRWVLVSGVISVPLAWLGIERWLEGFAYHTDMPWGIFIFAILIALVIALLTISIHTIRSGLQNPVDSIRYE